MIAAGPQRALQHMSCQRDLCRGQGETCLCSHTPQLFVLASSPTQAVFQVPGNVKLNYFDAEDNMQDISVEDLTKGKKVMSAAVLYSIGVAPWLHAEFLAQIADHGKPSFLENLVTPSRTLEFTVACCAGCSDWRTRRIHTNLQLETSAWIYGEG